MQRPRRDTVTWLAVLWVVNVALFVIVQYVALRTISGQLLDTAALAGNSLGRRTVDAPLDVALNAVSLGSIAFVLVTIVVVSVVRRRYSLGIMSAAVVVGSAGTSYLLKEYVISRPEYGVDPERIGVANSFPSGHASAAAAFAIGLTLVLPPAAREIGAILGATYAGVVGIATLSSGWHRPSDVIGAYLLAGAWAAFAGLVLVLVQRRGAVVASRDRAGWSLATAAAIGAGLTVMGASLLFYVYERMTTVEAMGNELQRLGYLGSAVSIAGSAYLMMAVVLISVHRVVPRRKRSDAVSPPAVSVGAGPL